MDLKAAPLISNGPVARQSRQGLRDERGGTLLEFAFAAIVFLMTIFGTLEFGIAVWRYNMVSDLAQEGARWASVHGINSLSPASAAEVQAFVQSRANGIQSLTVTTTPAPSTLGGGQTVTVTVQTAYAPLTGLIPQTTKTLRSTAKMIMAR